MHKISSLWKEEDYWKQNEEQMYANIPYNDIVILKMWHKYKLYSNFGSHSVLTDYIDPRTRHGFLYNGNPTELVNNVFNDEQDRTFHESIFKHTDKRTFQIERLYTSLIEFKQSDPELYQEMINLNPESDYDKNTVDTERTDAMTRHTLNIDKNDDMRIQHESHWLLDTREVYRNKIIITLQRIINDLYYKQLKNPEKWKLSPEWNEHSLYSDFSTTDHFELKRDLKSNMLYHLIKHKIYIYDEDKYRSDTTALNIALVTKPGLYTSQADDRTTLHLTHEDRKQHLKKYHMAMRHYYDENEVRAEHHELPKHTTPQVKTTHLVLKNKNYKQTDDVLTYIASIAEQTKLAANTDTAT